MKKTLIESIVFGLIVVMVGNFTGSIISKYLASNLPTVCKTWDKNYLIELCLFVTGIVSYLSIFHLKKCKLL